MAYALSGWDRAPRRFSVAGYQVRVAGFTYQDQNIIHVTEELLAAVRLPAPRRGRERSS